jgi:hypothetical protein
MSRPSRSLAVLATIALIGAGGSSSLAATHGTASKKGSSAPGRPLPSKGSSGSKKGSPSVPGEPPSQGASGSKRGSSSAPGPPAPR